MTTFTYAPAHSHQLGEQRCGGVEAADRPPQRRGLQFLVVAAQRSCSGAPEKRKGPGPESKSTWADTGETIINKLSIAAERGWGEAVCSTWTALDVAVAANDTSSEESTLSSIETRKGHVSPWQRGITAQTGTHASHAALTMWPATNAWVSGHPHQEFVEQWVCGAPPEEASPQCTPARWGIWKAW